MAISRHDPEWLKTIFIAKVLGVTFREYPTVSVYQRHPMSWWTAYLPNGEQTHGKSKYAVAKRALSELMGNSPSPPDAATAQPPPPGRGADRTEEFNDAS